LRCTNSVSTEFIVHRVQREIVSVPASIDPVQFSTTMWYVDCMFCAPKILYV
jgi:hypothetical protein